LVGARRNLKVKGRNLGLDAGRSGGLWRRWLRGGGLRRNGRRFRIALTSAAKECDEREPKADPARYPAGRTEIDRRPSANCQRRAPRRLRGIHTPVNLSSRAGISNGRARVKTVREDTRRELLRANAKLLFLLELKPHRGFRLLIHKDESFATGLTLAMLGFSTFR
jgi:hypothetical protein